jgi:hypothetical protein
MTVVVSVAVRLISRISREIPDLATRAKTTG